MWRDSGKYTPRAEQMNLFKLLCRGVNSISGEAKYTQKPRAEHSGKVPQIRGKMVHFPGEKWQNGAEINIFEGKVP